MRRFSRGRRTFLIGTGVAGAALVVGFWLREGGRAVGPMRAEGFKPNGWLRVGPDGSVSVIVTKSEMGQGVHTSLPMLVAEELEIDWRSVRVEQAPSDPEYGYQSTGGSGSVRGGWKSLREAGAAARTMLIAAAADRWGVPPADCHAENGEVIHRASGQRLRYGDLVDAAARQPMPAEVRLKDPSEFRIIGQPVPRTDLEAKVTGQAIYGLDVSVPGMLTAMVVRCPVFGGRVASVDARQALAVEGVREVIEIDRGVAVVAETSVAAQEGRARLTVTWDNGPNAGTTSESIWSYLREQSRRDGLPAQNDGEVDQAMARSVRKFQSVYEVPFQAHATMEPMNCVARVDGGYAEVWAPTQSPSRAQEVAAGYVQSRIARTIGKLQERLGSRPPPPVRVHTTQLGCGFGRRLEQDYVAEAVQISKAIGAPVKVIWSREDDLQHDYYRPATYNEIAAGMDADGQLLAWRHKIVGPSLNEYLWPGSVTNGVDWSLVEGATKLPYAIPNVRVEYVMAPTPVPLGFWRSVGHSHNAFVVECFLDELAAVAGMDPLAFRLRLLADAPRARRVLELAAEKAGWGRARRAGRFLGLAFHHSFHSHVAQVAEVSVDRNRGLRVHRVVCVVDCGQVVNPDTVTAQMEGGIAFGLTATIKGEITLAGGRVQQTNFHDYPVLRMSEMPSVETVIVPSGEPPGGIGEPGVPPIAPAVANAVFAATGKRIRRLPIRPGDLGLS